MYEATGYHLKLIELTTDLVNHGFGQGTIDIHTLKDGRVKVDILCGKRFIFFIDKEITFDKENII